MLIKVWVSFVPLHSWKRSSKAETCMKMCDRTVLHASSVVLLNSCRLPSPCFNCGFYSPDHLTLTTTILNSLSQLYNTYAAQCSSCGLRTLDIAKHLDWHFRSIVSLIYTLPTPTLLRTILLIGATESLNQRLVESGMQVRENGSVVTAAPPHLHMLLLPKMFNM